MQLHWAHLPADEVTTHLGIPVTTVPRTLLDLSAVVQRDEVRSAMRQAEQLRLTDRLGLGPLIERYPRKPGIPILKAVFEEAQRGLNIVRSEFEERFQAFLLNAGLPMPLTNVRIEGIEVDCAWPEQRVIVELDGRATHDTHHAFEHDRARDRRLEAAGRRVIRVTWRQLHDTPAELEADLRRLLAEGRARDGVRAQPLAFPSQMIGTNQFKNGTHIEVDGTVFKIVEFQHVKPGKGGAFVRTKLKRSDDGAVIDRTFRAGEKFRPVRTESRKMTFLYADGTDAHFMDTQTYEQMAVPQDSVAESLKWVVPNEEVDMLYVDDQPSDVQVPSAVELSVAETEPGVRGDTASGGGDKPATLESGVVVRVPLFVNVGDRVRVDTRSGEYVSRA